MKYLFSIVLSISVFAILKSDKNHIKKLERQTGCKPTNKYYKHHVWGNAFKSRDRWYHDCIICNRSEFAGFKGDEPKPDYIADQKEWDTHMKKYPIEMN